MSPLIKFNNKKSFVTALYKILHDLLFIMLVFLAVSLLAEGVLPGIISEHVGISKIIIPIAGIIFLISLISPMIITEAKNNKTIFSKKTIFTLSIFGILLVSNSMLKISLALNLAITVLAVAIIYAAYAIIMKEEKL